MTSNVARPCNHGLTLDAAKDVSSAALLIRQLKSDNADLKALVVRKTAHHEDAKTALAETNRRVQSKQGDVHALMLALKQLNTAIASKHEALLLRTEVERNVESTVERDEGLLDQIADEVVAAKDEVRDARRELETAAYERAARIKDVRAAELARRARIQETQTISLKLRRAEAAKLKGELQSARLQRELAVAQEAVRVATAENAAARPAFISVARSRSASQIPRPL